MTEQATEPRRHDPAPGANGGLATLEHEPSAIRLMDVPLGSPTRPSWRGRLHLIALVTALPVLTLLAAQADGARARVAVVIYGIGLCSMLSVSTTYHRWVHSQRARAIWQRADHATIYAAIGGTVTPFCLIPLGTGRAVTLLVVFWGLAAVGAITKIGAWRNASRVGTALYVGLGWAGLVLVPPLWERYGPLPVSLLFFGGVMYTIGAIGFARHWPSLRPSVFSYHEVWHAFTIAAASAHLAAVWIVAT